MMGGRQASARPSGATAGYRSRRRTARRAPCPRAARVDRALAPAVTGNQRPPARTGGSRAETMRATDVSTRGQKRRRAEPHPDARAPRAAGTPGRFATAEVLEQLLADGLLNSPSIVRENSQSNATPLSAMPTMATTDQLRGRPVLPTIRRMPTNPFSFGTPMSDNVISSHTAATSGIAIEQAAVIGERRSRTRSATQPGNEEERRDRQRRD